MPLRANDFKLMPESSSILFRGVKWDTEWREQLETFLTALLGLLWTHYFVCPVPLFCVTQKSCLLFSLTAWCRQQGSLKLSVCLAGDCVLSQLI